jgi:hypothetical protein
LVIPIPHLDDTDNQWNFDSDITWTSATRKKQHWKTSPHPKPINNPYSLSAQTKYQRNVTKNDVDIPDHIRIFTMPKHGQKQKRYESFDKRHFLLPHKHINEMEIPGSFIPSAQKRLQQPKHKPGTAHTNKHIKPTENCAFCACKQQQWINKRIFAFNTRRKPKNAYGNDHPQQMDTTNSLDFSVYQCHRRSKNGSTSTNGHMLTAPTHPHALALYDKQLQPKNLLYEDIRNDNYYACLTAYDTHDEDDDYGNDNTTTASYNGHIKNKGNLHQIQKDHNPSLPPCIKRTCTFKDFLPFPLPLNSTMTQQYTNGTLTHQKKNDGHNYNNETNSNNGINNHHGNKPHLRTHRTSTACNDNEIPSACRPHEILTRKVQPIL